MVLQETSNERVQRLTKGDIRYTETNARPTASSYPYRDLDAAQATWDEAEAQRQRHMAAVKRLDDAREAREAEQREAMEAEQATVRAARDTAFVDDLRRRYLASDPSASPEDFAADLPAIRRAHRIAATQDTGADDAAREAHRRALRSL